MNRLGSGVSGALGGERRRTAHEFVRDTLRRAILSGQLPGGTRLVQAEIASELEVSTTPVREALRDLASEDLIRLDAHRGAIVREVDLDEVREIYELRSILEPHSMRRAITRITPEELAEAERIQGELDVLTDDVGRWVELNRRFHGILTDACGSPRLIGMLKSLRDTSAVYVGLSLRSAPEHLVEGNAEHHRLLAAFRARDPDAAAAAIREHLQGTMRVLGLLDSTAAAS
jgi:DNA-binding GntR family transcriptional regulator